MRVEILMCGDTDVHMLCTVKAHREVERDLVYPFLLVTFGRQRIAEGDLA